VRGNVIRNNPSTGILGFENPDPFPPTPQTVYFQLSGNAIVHNRFSGNGMPNQVGSADITLLGGLFGTQTSVNNCASGNQLTTSSPPDIQGMWSCRLRTTPNPGGAALGYVLALMTASEGRTQVGQPAPPSLPTMNTPCAGVPSNPLCP
jgi:hypothetical protein